MGDFLTRLAERTLGVAPVVQPMIASVFAPETTSYSPALEWDGEATTSSGALDRVQAPPAWDAPKEVPEDSATPEHDSYALVGKVRSLDAERGGRIPAAALTAFARTDERVRRMLEAFQCDLPKPVEPATLTAHIARLTGRERRRAARSS